MVWRFSASLVVALHGLRYLFFGSGAAAADRFEGRVGRGVSGCRRAPFQDIEQFQY